LIPIIQQAEKNGQVTGLLTDGHKLVEDGFRKNLLESGLDHLLFTLSPTEKDSWFALQAILNEDLFTTVHITINPRILSVLPQTIDQCRQYGANGISLSTTDPQDPALGEALIKARSMVAEADLPLKWDLPVPYSNHNPVSIELENDQEIPPGAGKAWFYIEPDGDVLPGQGINEVLGNMLNPDWQQIWESGEE
jgi:MoaA/NifB/PqqE/SkfB family radical SAM enzyme